MGRKTRKKGSRNHGKANHGNRNAGGKNNVKNGRVANAVPPNFFNFLNRPLAFRVLLLLSAEERLQLGLAFPRFRVAKPQQQQQQQEQPSSESQPPKDTDTKNTQAEMFIPEDPHTLLARLNSKRLHRRVGHLRKHTPGFDLKEAYVLNKTTEQIAILEWQGLMTGYNKNMLRKNNPNNKDEEQEDDEEEESPRVASLIPSPMELLLFSPCPRAVAVLASYPRSGNSLLRTLYERTTLRVTGSDMRGGLTKHDLVGEAATEQNAVQFVKTHFPERRGTVRKKKMSVKCIITTL